MTYSPESPDLRFDDLDGAATALRRAGCRFSAARRLVLEALFTADGPVSAEYIADGLGGRVTRSDPASVYRNLERLEEVGVVRHVHIGHGPGLYAVAGRPPREYLVCERCNAIKSVAPEALEPVRAEIRSTLGYETRFSHFPMMGLCQRCAGIGSGPDASRGHQRTEQEQEHSHGHRVHSHPLRGEHTHSHGPD